MSGCNANKSIIGKTINVLRANFKYLFKVNLDPKINDKNMIKGLKTLLVEILVK